VKALDIKPGDEVVVPAYTFVAVAQAVLTCGGIPVFADIDDTFTISPDSIASVLSPRTRAVIAVHMFGNVADLGRILALTGHHKIAVIEDCAQAIGARYKGKRVGSIGDIGCFSFNEKKALPTGQGGMITTSNRVFLHNIVASRNTGIEIIDHRTDVTTPGFTMFMTEMEASLARGILPKVDALNRKRQKNYTDLIKRLTNIGDYMSWYRVVSGAEPSYSRFVCMVDFRRLTVTRDVFLRLLRTSGIPVKAFYPTPLYRYSLFQQKKSFFAEHPCTFSERFCRDQIGMEFSPYLTHGNLAYFAEALQSLIHDRRKK
jgi:perosamine synthetase